MNRGLLTYIGQQPRLPAGYREVEYLESTGVQWIDTGVLLDNESGWEVEVSCNKHTSNYRFFGSGQSAYDRRAWLNAQMQVTPHITSLGWNENINIQDFVLDELKHKYSVNLYNGRGVLVDGAPKNITLGGSLVKSLKTAFLFGANQNNGSTDLGFCKYYSAIMTQGNNIIRNYTPCVRTSDGKPGMYDICGSICPLTNSQFYVNAGTGADFLWGEKKPDFFPTYGMVYWNPLDKWRTRAATGQSITYAGTASSPVLPTEATYKGIPCCQFPPDSLWYVSQTFKAGAKAYKGTLSCWVASNHALVKWKGSSYIVCIRKDTSGYIRYGVDWQNALANLSAGTHDNAVTYNGYTSIPNNTKWHHYCLLTDVPETPSTSQSTDWHCVLYLDGEQVWEGTQHMTGTGLSVLMFGQARTSDSNVFSIAGVRAYNRLLKPAEIVALSQEYTPEA